MNEHDAITLLKQGDLKGLEALVNRHQVDAVQAAFLIVGDRAAAEDIAQSAFLRAAQRIHQFDDTRPFRPWFMRIVINDALKATRRSKRLTSLDAARENGAFPSWLQDPGPEPEAIVDALDERRKVWKALRSLAPRERAVIVRRYFLDMSGREIAQTMGLSIGAVKWALHTAREQLRAFLPQANHAEVIDRSGRKPKSHRGGER